MKAYCQELSCDFLRKNHQQFEGRVYWAGNGMRMCECCLMKLVMRTARAVESRVTSAQFQERLDDQYRDHIQPLVLQMQHLRSQIADQQIQIDSYRAGTSRTEQILACKAANPEWSNARIARRCGVKQTKQVWQVLDRQRRKEAGET